MMQSPSGNNRVPEPVLPPWAKSSTEHVYAMPARVIRASGESLEQHDPRSVGSLVSLDSGSGAAPWSPRPTADLVPTTTSNDSCSDPVISRIKRDFERKQEFLRTTNLPNYLSSPTSATPPTLPSSTLASPEPSSNDYYKQQPTIVQPERPPVYFGDRFPVHQQYPGDQETTDQHRDSVGQFHLYGLQLGKQTFFLSLRPRFI